MDVALSIAFLVTVVKICHPIQIIVLFIILNKSLQRNNNIMISIRTPKKAAQHKTYEESLQSTEKRVLATLKELTSPLAATSSTDDGTSNHFSPSAFKERLETYQTSTYFAKPVSLSPIICARFG